MIDQVLNNMVKGLVLHDLRGGTVDKAIEQRRDGGVPEELLRCLPGMMFEVTAAAGAIFGAGRDFDEVVDELVRRVLVTGNAEDFGREDAKTPVKFVIEFF